MPYPIKNFLIQDEFTTTYQPFPEPHLAKWRWLERPLSCLLNKLGATEVVTLKDSRRVEFHAATVSEFVLKYCKEFIKHNHEMPSVIVVGKNHWRELRLELMTNQQMLFEQVPIDILMEHPRYGAIRFRGVDIVLDPFIDGILPLRKLP